MASPVKEYLHIVAGLGERYNHENGAGIPSQWQRFHQVIDDIPHRVGKVAYGVCCNADNSGNFEYITGVRVRDFSELPDELATVRISPQRYAVFRHPGHVSMLRRTHYTIWNKWLPGSSVKFTDGPSFERYGKDFDGRSGTGTIEVWMPVARL